ncbi:hypothetical protein IEQ34_004053 [Dendrobium chrysotoxum]|uniref:Polyamine transporter n=1 Tax=Dendrobium chrysotoxum TaxID=161865 RepID=A0AAV7GYD0_DENCH|nr:hypothetical protein IEQ34_004053 [Dendrobium chrysotoxum]
MTLPTSIARLLQSFRLPLQDSSLYDLCHPPTTAFSTSVARRLRSFLPPSPDNGPSDLCHLPTTVLLPSVARKWSFRPSSPTDYDPSDQMNTSAVILPIPTIYLSRTLEIGSRLPLKLPSLTRNSSAKKSQLWTMNPEIQLQSSPISTRSADTMPETLHESSLPKQSTNIKKHQKASNKLGLLPLVFLIYFEVSGGPFGSEQTVQAGGPLLAILGFVLFPFVWSIPEALITAELATALPGNGGFVLWADRAFGSFSGSIMGSWKFLSGAINSAAFPALCVDYVARAVPSISSGAPRVATVTATTVLLSFLNYTGLSVVGYTAMALCAASLFPFFVLAATALPKLRLRRWGEIPKDRNWRLFFNTLFWNLNFWDNASTLAGEIDNPQKTFPMALLVAGLLTSVAYLMPLLAGTGALDVAYSEWDSGFYADVAGMFSCPGWRNSGEVRWQSLTCQRATTLANVDKSFFEQCSLLTQNFRVRQRSIIYFFISMITGHWLKYWVEVGAVLSAIGLYEAQLSSSAFQLLGMADLGFVPKFFSLRSKRFNTPWVGILTSSLISLGISFLSLEDIISSANFLYSLGMLLEIASFLWLRRKEPRLKRPFHVPFRMPGLIFMCLVPSGFLIYVMALASWKVFVISGVLTLFGSAMYFFMELCKSRGFLKFTTQGEKVGEVEEEEGKSNEA